MGKDATKDDTKSPTTTSEDKKAERSTSTPLRGCNSSSSDLPRYYDSEPSSQPPVYNRDTALSPNPNRHKSKPSKSLTPAPETTGASAASIAAILGSSSMEEHHARDKETRMKRGWGRRIKDFCTGEGWNTTEESGANLDYGSSANWNYFGSRLDGRQNRGRVLRR